MKRLAISIAMLLMMTVGARTAVLAAQAQPRSAARPQPPRADQETFFKGIVLEIFGPRLLSIREVDGQELLVLAPREISTEKDATVAVTGTLHRVDDPELRQVTAWSGINGSLRTRLSGRRIVVATAVLASSETPEPAGGRRAQPAGAEPTGPLVEQKTPAPLPLPASTLVDFIQTFAGQAVRIQNARVVGLIAPNVFLIEPATRYLKDMGQRDRMAVFIEGGQLRIDPELLVGAIVELEGTARTVLSVQASGDVEWPAKLNPQTIDRLEIRAAVIATSVRTAEHTELTDRRTGGAKY